MARHSRPVSCCHQIPCWLAGEIITIIPNKTSMTSDLVDVVYHNGRGLAAPGCRGWSHVWAQVHGLHALVNLLRFLHHLRVQSIASQLGRRKKGSLSSSGVWLYSWPHPVISAARVGTFLRVYTRSGTLSRSPVEKCSS